MNTNFGILPEIAEKHPKKMRKQLKADRAQKAMDEFVGSLTSFS